jgi:aminopeptidase N
VFRGFSAPVRVALSLSDEDLIALLRHDTDPFNRWEASQTVATRLLVRAARSAAPIGGAADHLAAALLAFLASDAGEDLAFAALVLQLPSEAEVAQDIRTDVDPDAIHHARMDLRSTVGAHLAAALVQLRERLADEGPYNPDAASAGRRALRNQALDLIAASDGELGTRLASEQLDRSSNMTDRLAALGTLALLPRGPREQALSSFADLYREEPLVLDKWFAIQAAIPEPDALDRIRALMRHPAFTMTNPNRVRALVGSFSLNNPTQFHRPDGAGYDFVADVVLELDRANPQVAARLLTAFGTWRTMERTRRTRAEQALRRIAGAPSLSPDVADIAQRSLG